MIIYDNSDFGACLQAKQIEKKQLSVLAQHAA